MAMAKTQADIAIGGGAAGAGKSFMAVMEALRHHKRKGFDAIIFRRESPMLTGPGSVWEEAQRLYLPFGATMRHHKLDARFPSGASVKFSHLQYDQDVQAHLSKAYCLIIWEEMTQFTAHQFWNLNSRNRSTCGIRPYQRGTCNPDPDSFLAEFIEWWIDQDTGFPNPDRAGVLRWFLRDPDGEIVWADHAAQLAELGRKMNAEPKSVTFIPGRLDDNKILLAKDPGYRSVLASLPRVERQRFLEGNWKVRAHAGDYFQRSAFEIIGAEDLPAKRDQCRAWDKAATKPSPQNPDPDWTAGPKWSRSPDGVYFIEHVERFREGPATVETRIRNTATTDGVACQVFLWQDPGSAGKADLDHYKRNVLNGFRVRSEVAREDKTVYAGQWSSQVEAGNVKLVRGPWNEAFLFEAEAFPSKRVHDDQIDGCSGAYRTLTQSDLDYLRAMAK
jgi:predicted phage terminase large subunit-like protein